MVMIEKMKFLSITGPKADIDRMTETYLSKYEIHLENALSELTEVANLSPFLEINPYKEALSTIDSFYEQLEDPSQISPELMDIEKAIKTVRAVQDGFRRLEEEKSRLQSEHAEILDPLKIIRPFKNLNFDVSEILNFKYIHYRFGRIEKQYLQKFEKYIYDNLDTLFIKCGEDEMYVYGVYFVPEHQAHKVMPYTLPCTLNVFLFQMNTMEPPQRLLKSLTPAIVRFTKLWMPTKRHPANSFRTTAQRLFQPKLHWMHALPALISANWPHALLVTRILSIFYVAG